MSPLFSLNQIYPTINASSDRPALCLAVITATGLHECSNLPPCTLAPGKAFAMPFVVGDAQDTNDPALNIDAQKSASKVTNVESE